MGRIAQMLKIDKRTNKGIKADVLATRVILQYDNIILNMPTTHAARIAKVLQKAVDIQSTRKVDGN